MVAWALPVNALFASCTTTKNRHRSAFLGGRCTIQGHQGRPLPWMRFGHHREYCSVHAGHYSISQPSQVSVWKDPLCVADAFSDVIRAVVLWVGVDFHHLPRGLACSSSKYYAGRYASGRGSRKGREGLRTQESCPCGGRDAAQSPAVVRLGEGHEPPTLPPSLHLQHFTAATSLLRSFTS